MAEITKCPIKDAHYYEVLKRLNGNVPELTRIFIAYGEELPSIEQMVKDGVLPESSEQPKFQAVIDNYTDRRSSLYRKLSILQDEFKKSKGKDKLTVGKKVQLVSSQIEELTEKIDELTTLDDFNLLYPYAKADLQEANKILNTENVSMNDMQKALRIIKLWKKVGSITDNNPFFSPEELEAFEDSDNIVAQEIHQNLKIIQSKAEILDNKWFRIAEDILRNRIDDTFGKNPERDYSNIVRDISKMASLTLDISEYDNIIAKAMFQWNKIATYETNLETTKVFRGIEEVLKKVLKRFTNAELEEIYTQTQSNTDSRKTGDLVSRWSQKWSDWDRLRREKLDYALEKSTGDNRRKLIANSTKEYNDSSIMLDARKLFPIDNRFSDSEIQSHKQELINTLGQQGYEFYLNRLKDKVDDYKLLREAEEENLRDTYGSDEASIIRELERFDALNSPYLAADSFYDGKFTKVANEYINYRRSAVEIVPKRFINGKDTGFYDKKFERIENDKDLKALYDYLIETIHTVNSYLPQDIKKNIHSNTLPFIRKDITEQFSKNGLNKGFAAIKEGWVNSLRTGMGGTRELSSGRDIEGEKIRQVLFTANTDVTKIINDYIDRKTIEFYQKFGESPENELILKEKKLEWRKEIQDELSKDRSFNFEAIVKLYSMAAISYKHKSKIEDSMNIAYSILNNALEQQITNAGEDIRDQYGKPITKKGLESLMSSIDYFMTSFYGEPTTLVEGAFGEKIYTAKEKLTKEELEALSEKNKSDLSSGTIDNTTFLKRQRTIESQLAKLGGKKTISALGDNVNMWIRLKGLGWNFFAPTMNAQVGFFTNITEGSGGKRFTQKQIIKAYGQVFFNKTGKISNLMQKLDVLKEVQNEAYASRSVAKGWRKRLSPFYLTSRAEYLNQAPVMIATMMNTKVKVDGKEMSLWEAYDNDGNLPDGIEFINDVLGEVGVKTRIDQTIKDIHGNYDPDSPIKANQSVLGRSLLVFRKWMINSYYNRFRPETFDEIEGFSKKGRWRSYGNYFSEYGAFGGVFQLTLQLGKKMMFMNTNFDKRLSDVDAQNMRKNLTEIVFLISTTALALLLKAITSGDDDDESDIKYLCYFYINQLGRLERDIMFYIDPQQFKSVLKDPLPVMGVVGDTYDLLTRSFTLVTGGEDTYQSGFRKDQSKTWVSVKKIIPGATNIDRLNSMTSTIIGD